MSQLRLPYLQGVYVSQLVLELFCPLMEKKYIIIA